MADSIAALPPISPPLPAAADRNSAHAAGNDATLTPEERAEVADLKRHDREIRAHEQAHAAAGGP